MSHILLKTTGGTLCLPDPRTLMIDRADGGQLVVNPPRKVWDRSALSAQELIAWNFLVAASARAMLECLPQLEAGCLNYWDAGNWALNDRAEPLGTKVAPEHRFLHQHLIGRSPQSTDPDWRWGEAPIFPSYAERFAWSERKELLSSAECVAIVGRARVVLTENYQLPASEIETSAVCEGCKYPSPKALLNQAGQCATCAAKA